MLSFFENDYILDRKDMFSNIMHEFDKKSNYSFNSTYFHPETYQLDFDNPNLTKQELDFLN